MEGTGAVVHCWACFLLSMLSLAMFPANPKNPAHAGLSCCSVVGDKVSRYLNEGTT
jgi:hypothetical protein